MLKGLVITALFYRASAQSCTTAAACSAAGPNPGPSVCTLVREQSRQCTSIAQGSSACVTYARPGTPFLPYGSYGAGTKRTASLFRLQSCQGSTPLRLVDDGITPSSFPYEIREDFGPGTNAGPLPVSADSSLLAPPAYPVNELYKARFLILLDLSNSMLPFYTPAGLNALYQQILTVGGNGLYTQYLRSGTQPFEFAIFAFAGERRLLQLTQWSAFADGAAAVLLSPAISTDWLGSRPYPFADDSSAFYWAVPEAIRTLQERSAAGRAADLLPFQLDCLIVVSDGFDTAGFAPTGASAPQNPYLSYQQAVSAASGATQPIRFITVYPPANLDASSPTANAARGIMYNTPNSDETPPGGMATAAITRYTNFLEAIPDGPLNGNSLMMLEFCPAYKGAGPSVGLKVNALAAASASPAPPSVSLELPYPAPPNGRCAAFPFSPSVPPLPTPTQDPCDPIFSASPTPAPFAPPSACQFFGGSACGRTSARTDLALRLECNCEHAGCAAVRGVQFAAPFFVYHPPPPRPTPFPLFRPLPRQRAPYASADPGKQRR